MKNMKKLIIALVAVLVVFPFITKVNAAEPGEKVKVYVFEAGGCPYCEKEIEYLKSLSSYNQKFEIVEKELYIDHINWENGADYQLGVNVANAFKDKGFSDAAYNGTPFVVISDLYAAAAYSTSLESVIEEAYNEGDKDIVKCYADGKTDCLDHLKEDNSVNSGGIIATIIVCSLVMTVIYLVKSSIDTKNIIDSRRK